MEPKELNDTQKKMLAWIEKAGAASPSRLSAEAGLSPKETWGLLNQMAEWGYVVIRDDPDSVDGALVLANAQRTMSQFKQIKRK